MNRAFDTSGAVVWNIVGIALPAVAHLLAIPPTVRMLGAERFGFFAVLWLWTAYFLLFDLGIARALTRFLAERIGSEKSREMPELVMTALALMARFGLVGSVVAAAASPALVLIWLDVPADFRFDAVLSLVLVSVSLPFLITAAGWRAVLEAHGRFDIANALQIPVGVASALLPLLVLWAGGGLLAMATMLLAIRIAGLAANRRAVQELWPELVAAKPNSRVWRGRLLDFGGWVTVSNALGPLMVYLDRFILGGVVSLTALTYYTASFELVTRAWLLAGAAIGVFFPAISARLANERDLAGPLYRRALIGVIALVLPPLALASLFAQDLLGLWLGKEFAIHGSDAMRLLSAGVLINCVAQVAQTVVYAGGRTEWVARLHLLELPVYLSGLWWVSGRWGVMGIAAAWTLRVTVDAIGMTVLARRTLPSCRAIAEWYLGIVVLIAGTILTISWIGTPGVRLAALVTATILCMACALRMRRDSIQSQLAA